MNSLMPVDADLAAMLARAAQEGAAAMMRALQAEGRLGPVKAAAPADGRTVGQLYDDWVATLPRGSKSRMNRVSQGRHLRRPFKHRGRELVMADLTLAECEPAVFVSWQTMLSNTESELKPGQALAPGTVDQIRMALQCCFLHYVRLGELQVNPLDKRRVPRVAGADRQREGYFTREEAERYIAAFPAIGQYVIRHMWMSGCRISNIRTLRKHQVDIAAKGLHLTTKGGFQRFIPCPDVMMVELEHLMALHPTSAYVYPSPRDVHKPVPEGTFQHWALKAQETTGLVLNGEKAVPHHLRHTVGVEMIEQGAALTEVQAQLGHSSITHSARYARVRGRGVDNVRKKNSARFGG